LEAGAPARPHHGVVSDDGAGRTGEGWPGPDGAARSGYGGPIVVGRSPGSGSRSWAGGIRPCPGTTPRPTAPSPRGVHGRPRDGRPPFGPAQSGNALFLALGIGPDDRTNPAPRETRSFEQLATNVDISPSIPSSVAPDVSRSSDRPGSRGGRPDSFGTTSLRKGRGSGGGPGRPPAGAGSHGPSEWRRTGRRSPQAHPSPFQPRTSPIGRVRTSPRRVSEEESDPSDLGLPPNGSKGAPNPPGDLGARGVADSRRPGSPLDAGPRRPLGRRHPAPCMSSDRRLAAEAPAAPRDHGKPHGVPRGH